MTFDPSKSPASQGYRMPAEWAPHTATWIVWPHKEASWPGKLALIPPVMAKFVRAVCEGEAVNILVKDAAMEAAARATLKAAGADAPNVKTHIIPTNDSWIRDHGPIFVTRPGATADPIVAIDWEFNAWGVKYEPYDSDNAVPQKLAKMLGIPVVSPGIVMEGGSIDTNGDGLLLTTEACLLNENRNPDLTREDIEQYLKDFLGIRKVLWLGDGIVGDDTDGHIDDLTRFVSKDTVVTIVESNKDDDNYGLLQENLERLRDMKGLDGKPLRIVELPMPRAIVEQGQRLPASYANFYISNAAVVVPIYEDKKNDGLALEILAEHFPGRKIVGVPSVDLVWGLGAFHCLSQQQPSV